VGELIEKMATEGVQEEVMNEKVKIKARCSQCGLVFEDELPVTIPASAPRCPECLVVADEVCPNLEKCDERASAEYFNKYCLDRYQDCGSYKERHTPAEWFELKRKKP